MSIARVFSPFRFIVVTVIHKALFQVSTQAAFGLRCGTPTALKGLPSRSVHVHADHQLAFVFVNANIVVVC